MENLFKFMLVRPPEAAAAPIKISVAGSRSAFLTSLEKLKRADASQKEMLAAAQKFADGTGFCSELGKLPLGTELEALYEAVTAKEPTAALNAFDANVKKIFGKTVREVAASAEFPGSVRTLEESIVAVKILSSDAAGNFEAMLRALRGAALLRASDEKNLDGGTLTACVKTGIVLPKEIFPLHSALRDPKKQASDVAPERKKAFDALVARHAVLTASLNELAAVKPADLEASVLRPLKGVAVSTVAASRVFDMTALHTFAAATSATAAAGSLGEVKVELPGVSAFKPENAAALALRLSAEGEKKIGTQTRSLLKEKGLSLRSDSLESVHARLEAERDDVIGRINAAARTAVAYKTKKIGGMLVKIPGYEFELSATFPSPVFVLDPDLGRIPKTHGSIKPAGVTELLIVKQKLKRYEAADVAHIENVLKGELKRREYTTTHTVENYYVTEAETTVSKESSVTTTERYEMSQAASEVIKTEESLKAGVGVKAKYGPAVEVNANVEGAVSHSRQKSVQHAENFSRSITQSSVEKITQRILEKQSIKTTDTIEDKNIHALDNTAGGGHISGIYQWVNKVYEAQIYNYGLRTMFDFMVPEPAAFVIETLKQAYAGGIDIVKPVAFPLSPDQIQPENYNFWVREYGATGVNPPPPMYLTKSEQFAEANIEKKKEAVHTAEIVIDEGYEAIYGYATNVVSFWEDDWGIDISVGQRTRRFEMSQSWAWTISLDNETGEIPVSLRTFHVCSYAVTFEVKCRRTQRAMDLWRQETYGLILQAYRNRLSEYEEKLAVAKAQAGVEISGKNPELNKIMIEEELKKHAVTLLSGQHFDMFGAIENGTNALPQIDLDEIASEGKYVRFFEQAFEWENMTYLFYPYFWGRKSQWVEKLNYEDTDPLFADFVKAGFSRVSVPVREGFEGAVDHFMQSGEVWNGGELPDVSSELYVAIAQEISEHLGRPGDEVPEGDPWEVTVPTTLVKLRQDQNLPQWKKDDDGNWVEDDG